MADKYLKQLSGVLTETEAKQTSSGASDAGKIPALDSTGRLDNSLMPVGITAETDLITASESLAAGDFVNLWSSSGVKARKADASVSGKEAHGFVLAAVASAGSATVYRLSQSNTQLTGMTPGAKQFLSASTPGGRSETAPSSSGQVVQILGIAKSATELIFSPSSPVVLA
jgi:hypothetical protein